MTKWFSVALLAFSMAACDESPVTLAELPEATSFASTVAEMRLVVGGTASLPGQVLDQNGRVIRDAQVVFVSDNPSVASVGLDGTVRAMTPGTANITATHGTITATTRVVVARDESGFIRTVDVVADSVMPEVGSPFVEVLVRAFTAGGTQTCPTFTIGVADVTVASVSQAANPCRLLIRGAFPGRTTITVSAEGVSDSVRVIVTAPSSRASFVSPANQAVVGSTVPYTVRVTDEAGNPIAGRTVNFDVSAGRLSATSVVTDANGQATVQFTVPTVLRDQSIVQIAFATALNGTARSGIVNVTLVPAPIATIQLFRQNNTTLQWTPIETASVSAALGEQVRIGANGRDQYGNIRGVTSGGTTAQADDFDFTVTPTAARVCTEGTSTDPNNNNLTFTCVRSTTAGAVSVTATAGGVSRQVNVLFAAP